MYQQYGQAPQQPVDFTSGMDLNTLMQIMSLQAAMSPQRKSAQMRQLGYEDADRRKAEEEGAKEKKQATSKEQTSAMANARLSARQAMQDEETRWLENQKIVEAMQEFALKEKAQTLGYLRQNLKSATPGDISKSLLRLVRLP